MNRTYLADLLSVFILFIRHLPQRLGGGLASRPTITNDPSILTILFQKMRAVISQESSKVVNTALRRCLWMWPTGLMEWVVPREQAMQQTNSKEAGIQEK